jgi:hypothetical protein
VRKYIALDGYVRHFLPIRGFDTMRDTLRHYSRHRRAELSPGAQRGTRI